VKDTVAAEAHKTSGNKFFKAKEYEKAIQEYSKGNFPPALWYQFGIFWNSH